MKVLLIEYPKCSTCKKAKAWLEEHGISYCDRHIIDEKPTKEELKMWYQQSGYPLKKFFNTSGLQYKALNLKETLPGMTEEEQLTVLASNGMLVKRPLVITEGRILIGFKENEWKEFFTC